MAVICWTLDIGIDKLFAVYTQNTVALMDFVINFHSYHSRCYHKKDE